MDDVTAQVPAALKHDYFPTPQAPSRKYLAHDVTVKPGSRLGHILQGAVVPVILHYETSSPLS